MKKKKQQKATGKKISWLKNFYQKRFDRGDFRF